MTLLKAILWHLKKKINNILEDYDTKTKEN